VTRERIFVWWVREFSTDGVRWFQVERRLVDGLTGELLDDVLASELKGRTRPPAAGDDAAPSAAVDTSTGGGVMTRRTDPDAAPMCANAHPARGGEDAGRGS
jgi:hypothetical protein